MNAAARTGPPAPRPDPSYGRDAATGSKHSRCASRRAARSRSRPGSAATPRPAGPGAALTPPDWRPADPRPRPAPRRSGGDADRARRNDSGPLRVPGGDRVQRLVAPISGGGRGGKRRRTEQIQQRAGHLLLSPSAPARFHRRAGSRGGRRRPCSPSISSCARSRPNRGCSPGCGPRSRLATGI